MSVFDWLFKRTPKTLAASGMFGWQSGQESAAGVDVTPETAMATSAVYACVSIIADAIGTLPAEVITRDGAGQVVHPIERLFRRPNPEMSAFTFRQAMMINLLLYGHASAVISRDAAGQPIELYPCRSANSRLDRDAKTGELILKTSVNGESFVIPDTDVFHLAGLTTDGLASLSPIVFARESIGLALATERFASKFFSNGGNIGGILELPAAMSPEAVKKYIASWKATNSGVDNALKTAVLTDGTKYTRTAIDPESAQMVATRIHQVREVARYYRVPLHMVGDLERATFSNIEEMGIDFVRNTLTPYAVRFEQEAERKLLTPDEADRLTVRFNFDALLRGNMASRYQANNVAVQGGWKTRNEVRASEGLPPLPGGDELLQPLNMGPAAPAANKPNPQPTAVAL